MRFFYSLALLVIANFLGLSLGLTAKDQKDFPEAKRVELKLHLDPSSFRAAPDQTLDLATRSPQTESVYFFDTDDLRLFEAGVIIRLRVIAGREVMITVKKRPADMSAINRRWLKIPGFKYEPDYIEGTKKIDSLALDLKLPPDEIEDWEHDQQSIRKYLSKSQKRFLKEIGGIGEKPLNRLKVWGPISSQDWKLKIPRSSFDYSFQIWNLFGEKPYIEISSKVSQANLERARRHCLAHLDSLDLKISRSHQTKTEAVFRALSKRSF